MSLAKDLYRQVSEDMARMPTPDLDADGRRIFLLIATMYDWSWKRINEPGFSIVRRLARNGDDYVPETNEEIAIWDELTASHNHQALVRYIDLRGNSVNDGIVRLHTKLLEASRCRLDSH